MLREFKAEFFKALAHPLRIRILDVLRDGECTVNEMGRKLGVEQSTLSQQLAVLRGRNFLQTRKLGANVFYSIRDPEVFRLLDCARTIFNNQLISVQAMLAELDGEAPLRGHRRSVSTRAGSPVSPGPKPGTGIAGAGRRAANARL
ncbi:MAG: ArsR/SmtB family transcription factor [Terriglobales bacterium]